MRKGGFTLIELLVVIGIISLLSSIVFASLGTARAKARDARRLLDMHNIQTALELYKSKHGVYPSADTVAESVCGGYDTGYKGPDDPGFIPGLVTDGIFGKTPGDPLSSGCGANDYVYKYERRNPGFSGCPQGFYILAIKNFETIPKPHPSSPEFKCGTYDTTGSDFAWVIGGLE